MKVETILAGGGSRNAIMQDKMQPPTATNAGNQPPFHSNSVELNLSLASLR